MVTIVARYRAQPGAGDSVAVLLAKHMAATRTERGCAQFDACRLRENPDEFVLYEKYIDEEAFEVHRNTAHFATFVVAQILPLLTERIWGRYDELRTEPF